MSDNENTQTSPNRELIESVWAEARDLIRRLEGSTVQRFAVAAGEYRIEIERGAMAPVSASAPGASSAPLPPAGPIATGAGPGLGVAPGARMASGVFTLEPMTDNRCGQRSAETTVGRGGGPASSSPMMASTSR